MPGERDRAVRELDHGVVVEGRYWLTLAERPVRTAEAGAREAHERTRGDVEEHREHEQLREALERARVLRDHAAPCALREPRRSGQRRHQAGAMTLASPSTTSVSPTNARVESRVPRRSGVVVEHLDLDADDVAGPHRRPELERLREVDRAVPRQRVADHCRDERRRDHAVRDAPAERRLAPELVVEVQRVAIGRGVAEELDRAVVDRELLHDALSDRDRHAARLLRPARYCC